MNRVKWLFPVLFAVLFSQCRSKVDFGTFNTADWEADKMGCAGRRIALTPDLEGIRRQLKGRTQDEVLDVLGKPDFQRLYQRNQKFYVYFMEPGPQCEGQADSSRARTAVLRFSAIGLVTEVFFDNGKPR